MIRIECPNCKRDSYTLSVENFRPCPYCNVTFSGKFGIDRRNDFRKKNDRPLVFSYNQNKIKARTFNKSLNGVGIKIKDNLHISRGDIVNVDFGRYRLKAKLMWSKRKNGDLYSTAGLKFLK
ncbi:MAG: PilZ domain-containing protein [Nitrospirae bacterium]|nr:PilZ domain-containing protein [Nitrospirota bacterium]